jgi:hypothetical protein
MGLVIAGPAIPTIGQRREPDDGLSVFFNAGLIAGNVPDQSLN